MPRRDVAREEILAMLSCDIDARPAGAATPDDLMPALRALRREPDALVLEFDPSAAELVEAYAAAERRCWAGIGWEVEQAGTVSVRITITLRITAAPAALDALALLWSPGRGV